MTIKLHDVIANPGSELPFRCELDGKRLSFPSVVSYERPPVGEGIIRNDAGALTLRGTLSARMQCLCDRCMAPFSREKVIPLELPLATELEDEEDPDYFLLSGEELDLGEALETCFILNMDSRFLCRPDCKGLCGKCGADLNAGPCACPSETDPRLAVLEQLLDDKEHE